MANDTQLNPDLKTLTLDVLAKGYLMSLATLDPGGVWVSDVIYVYDEQLDIYWMSDPEVRHSRAVAAHPQVAGTITVSGQGQDNAGIQFSGTAYKIDGPRYDLATKHFRKRKKPIPLQSEDVLQGDCWYMLHPDRIELIYEQYFGFNKQSVPL